MDAVESLRRCHIMFLELKTISENARNQSVWVAKCGHRTGDVEVASDHMRALQNISSTEFIPADELWGRFGFDCINYLRTHGLLVSDRLAEPSSEFAEYERNDISLREVPWWPASAMAMMQGRWENINLDTRIVAGELNRVRDIIEYVGQPPSFDYRRATLPLIDLGKFVSVRQLDDLLLRRQTCRSFNATLSLAWADFSVMVQRVWGVRNTEVRKSGFHVVHKGVPAGGGLHATEVYFLVQNVQGLVPGVYHYVTAQNGLELMKQADAKSVGDMIETAVAGQKCFRDVSVLAIMTCRFERLYWKYRFHPKAWRAAHLDAGHLSQTLYLSAVDRGLGAFVSAAINDGSIEELLRLNPIVEGAICVAGFGMPNFEDV